MRINIDSNKLFWRAASFLSTVAAAVLLNSLFIGARENAWFSISLKLRLLAGLELSGLLLCATWTVLTWLRPWDQIQSRLESAGAWLRRFGYFNLLPVALTSALLVLVVFAPFSPLHVLEQTVQGPWARLGLIWLCGLAAAPFLQAAFPSLRSTEALFGALFIHGLIYRAFAYSGQLSASPFTLGWSEGSRFYYSSLFYAPRLYGQDLPWPFLHPSRYLLLSLPYLFPGLGLAFHRFWQVALWLGMTGLTAYLFTRRLKPTRPALALLLGAWAFLFLFQGPVYYHLLVAVCIVLGGFDSQRFGRSLVVIGLASLWAGISRVNWFPVPAMLGITIYLLETRFEGGWWRYFRAPLAWGASGIGLAAVAQAVYAVISKQPDVAAFGSSFTSDLIWSRLLPSPTYPPGILPMILGLTLPVLILAALSLPSLHFWRSAALAGMTLVLFGGGLVVSTKIGGGSNLHNMDAYLVLLLVWAGQVWAGKAVSDSSQPRRGLPLLWILLTAALPFYPLVLEGGPARKHDLAAERAELESLREVVRPLADSGEAVLFIWNRQLLTFDEIQNVPFIADYETVELMEMAMSRNQPYLEQFHQELLEHRFSLIVADVQNTTYKGPETAFPEENNAWVDAVAVPLMQSYCEWQRLPLSQIQLLIPRVPGAPCADE
jgi:hypothetical protein